MRIRFCDPRTQELLSGELRLIFNRRVLVVTIIAIWLFVLVLRRPRESEVLNLHREILRTLTKSTFYGHEDISRSMWYFAPREKKITSLDFSFLIESADVCKNTKPTLLVAVMSLHQNAAQRMAIRNTYGSVARNKKWPGKIINGDIRMIFVFGVSNISERNKIVEDESKVYNDIVMVDFTESYFNLTYKVLMSIKWTKTYCPRARFIMKADEDTFVDIPRLTDVILAINMTNQIFGHFHYNDAVERAGKTKVSMEAYPLSWYAPHVKGNMYVMTTKLAMKILTLAQYLPYVNMEDAHVTGIIAKMLDARHHSVPLDQYDPFHPPKLCDFALHRKLFSQQVDSTLAYNLWKTIENSTICAA